MRVPFEFLSDEAHKASVHTADTVMVGMCMADLAMAECSLRPQHQAGCVADRPLKGYKSLASTVFHCILPALLCTCTLASCPAVLAARVSNGQIWCFGTPGNYCALGFGICEVSPSTSHSAQARAQVSTVLHWYCQHTCGQS